MDFVFLLCALTDDCARELIDPQDTDRADSIKTEHLFAGECI